MRRQRRQLSSLTPPQTPTVKNRHRTPAWTTSKELWAMRAPSWPEPYRYVPTFNKIDTYPDLSNQPFLFDRLGCPHKWRGGNNVQPRQTIHRRENGQGRTNRKWCGKFLQFKELPGWKIKFETVDFLIYRCPRPLKVWLNGATKSKAIRKNWSKIPRPSLFPIQRPDLKHSCSTLLLWTRSESLILG